MVPNERLLVSGGARFDWVNFSLDDNFLSDGATTAASRPTSALSGNIGASWSFEEQFVPYVNVSTSFETPTTTELVNQPDSTGGFNQDLGPQRAVNVRGRRPRAADARRDLLGRAVPRAGQRRDRAAQEVGGRAFFATRRRRTTTAPRSG